MMLNINENEITEERKNEINAMFDKWEEENEKHKPIEPKKETVKIPKKFNYDKHYNRVMNTMTNNKTTY